MATENYGYVFFYNGKQVDIYAPSKYAALQLAITHFKPPKSKAHMVHGYLAERPDGSQVVTTAS